MRDLVPSPELSIILPIHRSPAMLEASLGTVRAQSCALWEILALDDGAHDAGLVCIENAAQADSRIRIISQPGADTATLRNRAIAQARAPLIALLEPGDLWATGKLASHLALHRARPGLAASYARIAFIAPGASALVGARRLSSLRPDPLVLTDVLGEDPACMACNLLAARPYVQALGGFDAALCHAQDQDLLARMIGDGARIEGIDAVLTGHRLRADLPAAPARMAAGWRQVILRHYEGRDARRLEALHCRLIARHVLRAGGRMGQALPHAWRGLRLDARAFCGGWRAFGATLLACLAALALPAGLRRRISW